MRYLMVVLLGASLIAVSSLLCVRKPQDLLFETGVKPVELVEPSPGRVLVYITTHMSKSHIQFMESCWEVMVAKSKLLQKADFMFYAPKKPDEALLRRIFPTQSVEIKVVRNLQKQQGAIEALRFGFENGLFEKYDWVIRVNPDVLILDDTFLLANMLDDDVDGIFVECKERVVCNAGCENQADVRGGKTYLAHTDFFTVRPAAVDKQLINATHDNAEKHFTNAIRQISSRGRDRWINNRGTRTRGQCRIRGPTSPVQHHHGLFKYCPQVFTDPKVIKELWQPKKKVEPAKS